MHNFLKSQNQNNHNRLQFLIKIVFIFNLKINQYLVGIDVSIITRNPESEFVFLSFYSLQGLTIELLQQEKGEEIASETLSSHQFSPCKQVVSQTECD